jgi:hypothetical protein
MRFPVREARWIRAAFACAAMLLGAAAAEAAESFSAGLSAEERAACGAAKLTPGQVAALDSLVGRDVTLAHEGGVTGFSSAFSARHTAKELASAGIDRLSDKERSALDSYAARAIAFGPSPSQAFAYAPAPPTPAPAEKLVSAPLGLDVHGDVSFTVGAGSHGTSFYGTSADVFVTDPSGKFTLGFGVDSYRGRGFFLPIAPCLDPLYLGPPYLGPP